MTTDRCDEQGGEEQLIWSAAEINKPQRQNRRKLMSRSRRTDKKGVPHLLFSRQKRKLQKVTVSGN